MAKKSLLVQSNHAVLGDMQLSYNHLNFFVGIIKLPLGCIPHSPRHVPDAVFLNRRCLVATLCRNIPLWWITPLNVSVVFHASGVNSNITNMSGIFKSRKFDVCAHIVVTEDVRLEAASVYVVVASVREVDASVNADVDAISVEVVSVSDVD